MPQKLLIILGSARKDSDTAKFVSHLFAGTEATIVDLLDMKISHYNYIGNYTEEDQFGEVVDQMLLHDKIVFATPVYWYAMSGRMKVFFDRLTDIVTIRKTIGRKLQGKRTYLVAVGADPALPTGFELPFQLTSSYLAMNFKATYYSKTTEVHVIDYEAKAFLKELLP